MIPRVRPGDCVYPRRESCYLWNKPTSGPYRQGAPKIVTTLVRNERMLVISVNNGNLFVLVRDYTGFVKEDMCERTF